MTFSETIDYLYAKLPIFQRQGPIALKFDLNNIQALCAALGHPENQFKSVHVAGTNGKGSVSHMLASVLQEAGYRTGLYTSPHLKSFRERIRIDGVPVSEQFVVDFVAENKNIIEELSPSFFEITVAMAFSYFAEKVDIAIVETGMGGRLDSTNVILPLLSVITNIGLDHTAILGNTLAAIAKEKAGIIKKEVPVIIGEKNPSTTLVFEAIATDKGAPLAFAEELDLPEFETDLKGHYQQKNVRTAIAALQQLQGMGWKITAQHQRDGLLKVVKNTGLLGRWQVLGQHPLVVCDIAHNEDGIREVVEQLQKQPHEHLHIVMGMVADKNMDAVLKHFPKNATYYFCQANIPRALDRTVLMQKAANHNLKGSTYSSVNQAYYAAQEQAKAQDLIFIGGSTFVVAEIV